MACGAAIGAWQALHGAAAKEVGAGMTYCGMICDATGGHGGGQAVAASGAAKVGAGGHTGAGGGQAAGRLNQLHGQHAHRPVLLHEAHPPHTSGTVATASKASIFFIILCLLGKQSQITAWVETSECPIQTLNGRDGSGDMEHGAASSEYSSCSVLPTSAPCFTLARTGWSSWQAEQLYIGAHDVQTQPVDFFNILTGRLVKKRRLASSFRSKPPLANRQVPAQRQIH